MPISLTAAGLVAGLHVATTLVGTGALKVLTAIVGGLNPMTRHID